MHMHPCNSLLCCGALDVVLLLLLLLAHKHKAVGSQEILKSYC